MDKIYGYLIQYGLSFIAAILIFVIGKWVARLISMFIPKPEDHPDISGWMNGRSGRSREILGTSCPTGANFIGTTP